MDRYKPLVHEVTATVRMGAEPSGEYVLAADAEARIASLEADNAKLREALREIDALKYECAATRIARAALAGSPKEPTP